jgi:hypothetical protein
MRPTDDDRLDRRTALKWMFMAAASTSLFGVRSRGQDTPPMSGNMTGTGYGTDPDLLKTYSPGDFWPLTFTPEQHATAAALCAIIIPRDEHSPSAADLHVQDFIDEWVSAPYPSQAQDRPVVIEGLDWVGKESQQRFGASFAKLSTAQHFAICDDIGASGEPAKKFATAASFFTRFRELTASGFYTTPEGMRDIGYVGNIAMVSFDGPSPEVIKRLGIGS